MIETDLLWMAAAVICPLVLGCLLALVPRKLAEPSRWGALISQTFVLGLLIGIMIQFRYDTIERWGVMADESSRWLGSLAARMERLDLLPDYAVRPHDDWIVRVNWLKNPAISLLWTIDESNLWLAMCLGVVYIAAGMISFARGGMSPRFVGLLLVLQAASHLVLFASDFLSLCLGWGLLGLNLGLAILEVRNQEPFAHGQEGSLGRLSLWMIGTLALLAGSAGLAFTWNVRPVSAPDILQTLAPPGGATNPAQWKANPAHTLEFPTLQRLALAELETHWAQKPVEEVSGLLTVERLKQWQADLANPKGAALRRPMVPGLTKEQIEQGINLEQGRAVEALAHPPSGYQSQTLLFLVLLAAAWLMLGMPPFTGLWIELLATTPPALALPVACTGLALAWDLLTRVALPLAPLGIVSQLSGWVLWVGAAGAFLTWNAASSQPNPRKALGMIACVPLFALFTGLIPLFGSSTSTSGWWWGASGTEYLGGAAILSLALLLLGALYMGPDWKSFEGSWARSPKAVLALSLGLLAIAGLPGLAPFIGWFMAGLGLAGEHTMAMLLFFAGLAYGAWVAIGWIGLFLKPALPSPAPLPGSGIDPPAPYPVSALLASTGIFLLLLAGGVYPTLVLNWMEPGATAKAERIRAATHATSR